VAQHTLPWSLLNRLLPCFSLDDLSRQTHNTLEVQVIRRKELSRNKNIKSSKIKINQNKSKKGTITLTPTETPILKKFSGKFSFSCIINKDHPKGLIFIDSYANWDSHVHTRNICEHVTSWNSGYQSHLPISSWRRLGISESTINKGFS